MRSISDLLARIPAVDPGTDVEEWESRYVDDKQAYTVGSYRLGMSLTEGIDLTEMSNDEVEPLGLGVPGQKHYLAPPASFLGFRWIVIVGVVDSTIHGIKATTLTENITETIQGLTLVQEWYSQKLGEPNERNNRNAFCLWRTRNAYVQHQVFPRAWPCRNEIRMASLKSG